MQRRDLYTLDASADVLFAPVLTCFTMSKPVAQITRQCRIDDRRVLCIGRAQCLSADVGPSHLQPVARFPQPLSPRVFAQHLNAPSECRAESQCALMVKPSMK